MTGVARRRFLQLTAGAVGSTFAFPRVASAQEAGSSFDVVIVGGGMAGLFCALRLRAAGYHVGLFEASDRWGGRVLSVLLPGFSEQAAEVGAMRLRNVDRIENKLIDSLLGSDARQDFNYPTHAWFLRDRLLHSLDDPSAIPYGLDEKEREIIASGQDILLESFRELSGLARASTADQGLWQQLLKLRSKEGFNFIVDSLGYTSLLGNWSAAAGLPWFKDDFAPGTTYFKLKRGLQSLPLAMTVAFVAAGGSAYTGHRLRRIRRSEDGGFKLAFDGVDGLREVAAGRTILALTQAAIEGLGGDSFPLQDDAFRAALKTVNPTPLGKIHLAFPGPWWEGAGYGAGRTVTDLPLRQTYFWGTDSQSGKALAMASYHDGPAVDFWQDLDNGEAYGPTNWIDEARSSDGSRLPDSMRQSLPASKPIVEEAWLQMKQVHDLSDDAGPPLFGTYRNWGADPLYGAAAHFWRIGARPKDTMAYLREPFPGLHLCGEAWSVDQGWIKGATSTAEDMLQRKFGLPPFLSS